MIINLILIYYAFYKLYSLVLSFFFSLEIRLMERKKTENRSPNNGKIYQYLIKIMITILIYRVFISSHLVFINLLFFKYFFILVYCLLRPGKWRD